eukprot:g2787.t1
MQYEGPSDENAQVFAKSNDLRSGTKDGRDTMKNEKVMLPRPDLEAFHSDNYGHSPPVSEAKACPPTPVRTPAWVGHHRRHQSNLEGPHPTRLTRKSSLHSTKVLLELPIFHGTPETKLKFEEEYANLGRIGSGNFSDVYCVRSRSDRNLYAVKKSKRKFLSKRDRAIWMKEVEMFKRLGPSCAYIIQYYRAWQEEGYFFVQMELCQRGNLEDFLNAVLVEGKMIPEGTIWSWASHIASALNHIHSANVVHLDVKPQNVFLTKNGLLKLGDLGLARDLASALDDGVEGDSRYMAPELLNSSKVTSAVDIFSLGIMLFQISSVFVNLPKQGKFWRDLRESKIPKIRSQYTNELGTFIRSMMAADPVRRPSSNRIMKHKRIVNALESPDDFVVTTPVRLESSSPVDDMGQPLTLRNRCESAASDLSALSSDGCADIIPGPVFTPRPGESSSVFSVTSSFAVTPSSFPIATPQTVLQNGTVATPRTLPASHQDQRRRNMFSSARFSSDGNESRSPAQNGRNWPPPTPLDAGEGGDVGKESSMMDVSDSAPEFHSSPIVANLFGGR